MFINVPQVDELADGTGVLRALRKIAAGDWLSVAPSEDEEDGEEEESLPVHKRSKAAR